MTTTIDRLTQIARGVASRFGGVAPELSAVVSRRGEWKVRVLLPNDCVSVYTIHEQVVDATMPELYELWVAQLRRMGAGPELPPRTPWDGRVDEDGYRAQVEVMFRR